MKVAMIGTGYIGLVSGTCFAEIGHDVVCIDIDAAKIQRLNAGECPIYEPGLIDLLERNRETGRLKFSTDFAPVRDAQVVFLGVGTPSAENGQADLRYLKSAAAEVAKNISEGAIVVIKSTVPVGTHKEVKKIIQENTKVSKFFVVNNPEFLKEGAAIEDFMKPDRVVIGFDNIEAAQVIEELYEPLVRQGHPILKMSNLSAELCKYASNAFLATKISFINEMARLCDATGADIEEVRKGMTTDRRIGPYFLYPGPGYGGSCFPKDVKALIHAGRSFGVELKLAVATEDVNQEQKHYIFQKIKKHFGDSLKGKSFALWGVAFKPNTDDVRDTPAIELCEYLTKAGAKVRFYDPEAAENFESLMKQMKIGNIERVKNKYDCISDMDALILLTEWPEFRAPDFHEIKLRLKAAKIFDARNLYSPAKLHHEGFFYEAIGRAHP